MFLRIDVVTDNCKDEQPQKFKRYLDIPDIGGCYGEYEDWFKQNCQKSCQYCGGK